MRREAVVAGQFYASGKEALRREVEKLIDLNATREEVIGAVSPHAGYMYSGAVAGSVLSLIKPKNTYIILGPNHTGLGEALGIDKNEVWSTPLGDICINRELADAIKSNCRFVKNDSLSHAHEHSIEVQIPILQVIQESFKIVPIVVAQAGLEVYRAVGEAIAKSVKDLGMKKNVAIIASSDMTHYESSESAKKKDSVAIDVILSLDEGRLVDIVEEFDISMCGYAPTAIMLSAAKSLGAKTARLIKYQNSGDASGDYQSVVGYAGIIIK